MNILAIGAHHDDIELGCGGAIAKLAFEGHQVYGITLTDSETHFEQKNIYRSKEEALKEAERAAGVIGLQLKDLDHPKAKNGCLVYDVQLMRQIEKFIFNHKISQIFTHWRYDMNTDHEAASKLTTVAARHVQRILAFRSNWYQPDRAFNGNFYIDISDHIESKKKSLECYSVEIKNRSREWADTFINYNRSWGFSVGTKFAELFEVIRWVA